MPNYTPLEFKYRQIQQQLILGVLALGGVVFLGTAGYCLIEGWSLLDALYMTVITLASVGFMEVHPLTSAGRLFTIGLILMGVISIGYIVNRFTEAVIQGYFQEGIRLREQRRLMESLSSHYIVCGFGRTGRQVCLEFEAEGVPFLVIESIPDLVRGARQLGYTALEGDATLDQTLEEARIHQATCIVCTLPSDADNLYVTLSAKNLNPEVRRIARANSPEALKKLKQGGADAVISPYITGGRRMAAAALRPQVMDFIDGVISSSNRAFYIEEFLVDTATCPVVGQTLQQTELRSRTGALVLAIRRADGTLLTGPTADAQLANGDLLICMGTAEQLRALNNILSPVTSSPRVPKKKARWVE
ncbi:potassium channel protein [Leptolyngbya sp. FACHB-261]|nr:potassium channel protein [Leptolyngbya sp. FACHB-261]